MSEPIASLDNATIRVGDGTAIKGVTFNHCRIVYTPSHHDAILDSCIFNSCTFWDEATGTETGPFPTTAVIDVRLRLEG